MVTSAIVCDQGCTRHYEAHAARDRRLAHSRPEDKRCARPNFSNSAYTTTLQLTDLAVSWTGLYACVATWQTCIDNVAMSCEQTRKMRLLRVNRK